MIAIRKMALNLCLGAARVLGPAAYFRLVAATILSVPSILRTRTLQRVDALMGRKPIRVRFQGREFVIDAPYCDSLTRGSGDDSFTFGLVRELYVRNCYLPLPSHLDAVTFAIDCGANRGVFTALLTQAADRVVAVEAHSLYSAMIPRNAPGAIVETGFVGAGGDLAGVGSSIPELMERHRLPHVDLLKLDIEGSEFALFEDDLEWLALVRRLTMEVHPDFGSPSRIAGALHACGFQTILRDEDLLPSGEISFIYAYR